MLEFLPDNSENEFYFGTIGRNINFNSISEKLDNTYQGINNNQLGLSLGYVFANSNKNSYLSTSFSYYGDDFLNGNTDLNKSSIHAIEFTVEKNILRLRREKWSFFPYVGGSINYSLLQLKVDNSNQLYFSDKPVFLAILGLEFERKICINEFDFGLGIGLAYKFGTHSDYINFLTSSKVNQNGFEIRFRFSLPKKQCN